MIEVLRAADKVEVDGLDLHYGDFHALKQVSVRIPAQRITALIGPSGCGKSTLLRCLNRMNDTVPGVRVSGSVRLDGVDMYGAGVNIERLRRRVGMVFQRPNPFPLSVYDNVAYGPRLHARVTRRALDDAVEQALRSVGLWESVRERLDDNALELPAEQQQRLCIARALATRPEVLLMDEPCSALDPLATRRIEELMRELVATYTIVIVTHNMQQARRVAQKTGFMLLGELVEFGDTDAVFDASVDTRTADYVAGRFG